MQLGSDWALSLSNVSSASPNALFFFGPTSYVPGIPLSAQCLVYTTAQLGYYIVPAAAGVSGYQLTIPNDAVLLGFELVVQGTAASPDPGAWDGVAVSNGLHGVVGI